MLLFAEASAEVATTSGFFPPYFGVMLFALVLVFGLAAVLFAIGWRVVDWITPGKLDEEIVPKTADKKPNVALAVVVAAMVLGLSLVLSSTILAVLLH